METKFKVGDRVKFIRKQDNITGSDTIKAGEGYIVDIDNQYEKKYTIWGEPQRGGSYFGLFSKEEISGLSEGNKSKVKPPRFALQYELDKDPTEYFADMKEVKKRIKELAERSDLKRDSIFIHEIKNTKKVTLGLSISIGK